MLRQGEVCIFRTERNNPIIEKAAYNCLNEILSLQYLAYQSEAALFGGKDIPPLKQTLGGVIEEYNSGVILKMTADNRIIGPVRARKQDGTVYIGKLIVHPDHQRKGYGSSLLREMEMCLPAERYELFTSTRSKDNIRLYQKLGYTIFDTRDADGGIQFVFMEKFSK